MNFIFFFDQVIVVDFHAAAICYSEALLCICFLLFLMCFSLLLSLFSANKNWLHPPEALQKGHIAYLVKVSPSPALLFYSIAESGEFQLQKLCLGIHTLFLSCVAASHLGFQCLEHIN